VGGTPVSILSERAASDLLHPMGRDRRRERSEPPRGDPGGPTAAERSCAVQAGAVGSELGVVCL